MQYDVPFLARRGLTPRACALALLIAGSSPAVGQSNNVRISRLSDVPFGAITNFGADSVQSQSICIYSNTATNRYRVTGTGTGSGGAFTLASGSDSLAYEVQWNSSAGQSSGTQLSPNVPLTGQVTVATQQLCNAGPASSASLIVLIRSGAVSSAAAGTYSGTLTLMIGAE